MKDRMVDHLVHNQLIQNTQHGFMSKKSCLTNLLDFLEKITNETDDGKPIDIIYLDNKKRDDKNTSMMSTTVTLIITLDVWVPEDLKQ